jgi:hypothetical protein
MRRVFAAGLALWAVTVGTAAAQQRPLVTEDPEVIGAGNVLIEGGVEYLRDVFYPVSGLQGNLLRLPTLGVSFGLSSIAEFQIDGGIYSQLNVTGRFPGPLSHMLNFAGDKTTSVEDMVIATKIRLLAENEDRPGLALRFATRLPNAGNESGLGLDTTDFYATIISGKTIQSIRVVANFGLGILANPVRGDQQNDVYVYGLSLARAVKQGVEVVGDVTIVANFRDSDNTPIGTESHANIRAGGRFTRGTVRIDAGVIFGLTARDPSFGFTSGLTWVFKGFTVP